MKVKEYKVKSGEELIFPADLPLEWDKNIEIKEVFIKGEVDVVLFEKDNKLEVHVYNYNE